MTDELLVSLMRGDGRSTARPNAFAPAASDALQIACLHRGAHHRNSDLLIWLYDIHLLAKR